MREGTGYRELRGPAGARARVLPEAVEWLEGILARTDSVHAWAAGVEGRSPLRGRGTSWAVPAPVGAGEWVVRRSLRGGKVAAPLLGDRYLRLGPPRPFRELSVSAEARRRGVPTPEVVAAIVRSAGPAFYRGELVTRRIPGGVDLAGAIFPGLRRGPAGERSPTESGSGPRLLHGAGRLVRRLVEGGIRHPDLNAANLILGDPGTEAPDGVWVIDLDGARATPGGDPLPGRAGERMFDRLCRSLRKFGRASGRPLEEEEWSALEAGFGREEG